MQDIVSCGFVKGLSVSPQSGQVTFALELTTPACPIKDEFERKARDYVAELPWVQQVQFALAHAMLAISVQAHAQSKRLQRSCCVFLSSQLGLHRPCKCLALCSAAAGQS